MGQALESSWGDGEYTSTNCQEWWSRGTQFSNLFSKKMEQSAPGADNPIGVEEVKRHRGNIQTS